MGGTPQARLVTDGHLVCLACGIRKPFDPAHFVRESRLASGLASGCLDCKRASHRADHVTHREANNERAAQWRADNLETARERQRVANAKPETSAANVTRVKRWRAANPNRFGTLKTNASAKRRTQETGAFDHNIDRAFVFEYYGGICHICQTPADPTDWHLDHVVPLARGGRHHYDNVNVSHPTCNLRKGAKC